MKIPKGYYFQIIKIKQTERIAVYCNENLIGYVGKLARKKREKANLDKIDYISKQLF